MLPGIRVGRGESKHYRVIQALPLVMGDRFSGVGIYLDSCRRKRNISEYDAIGTISEKEAADLVRTSQELKIEVKKWLRQNYPQLCRQQG